MATINFTRSKDLVKTATFTWETLTVQGCKDRFTELMSA